MNRKLSKSTLITSNGSSDRTKSADSKCLNLTFIHHANLFHGNTPVLGLFHTTPVSIGEGGQAIIP
jgi:hypothetical protein